MAALSFSKPKPKPKIDHPAESNKLEASSNHASSVSQQGSSSRVAQPKAMRERTSMPVYNIKKLTYDNVKPSSNAGAAADPRPADSFLSESSARSSPDGDDVEMDGTIQDSGILDESSDDDDFEMGDADDETDIEELHSPVTSKTPEDPLAELTAENGRPYNKWLCEYLDCINPGLSDTNLCKRPMAD
jgi:hypothetical protein